MRPLGAPALPANASGRSLGDAQPLSSIGVASSPSRTVRPLTAASATPSRCPPSAPHSRSVATPSLGVAQLTMGSEDRRETENVPSPPYARSSPPHSRARALHLRPHEEPRPRLSQHKTPHPASSTPSGPLPYHLRAPRARAPAAPPVGAAHKGHVGTATARGAAAVLRVRAVVCWWGLAPDWLHSERTRSGRHGREDAARCRPRAYYPHRVATNDRNTGFVYNPYAFAEAHAAHALTDTDGFADAQRGDGFVDNSHIFGGMDAHPIPRTPSPVPQMRCTAAASPYAAFLEHTNAYAAEEHDNRFLCNAHDAQREHLFACPPHLGTCIPSLPTSASPSPPRMTPIPESLPDYAHGFASTRAQRPAAASARTHQQEQQQRGEGAGGGGRRAEYLRVFVVGDDEGTEDPEHADEVTNVEMDDFIVWAADDYTSILREDDSEYDFDDTGARRFTGMYGVYRADNCYADADCAQNDLFYAAMRTLTWNARSMEVGVSSRARLGRRLGWTVDATPDNCYVGVDCTQDNGGGGPLARAFWAEVLAVVDGGGR
ncbi:hypothetical protein DFH09DRAFT_1379107 [Mycena vulgaris]|nr:hypothetical protein DFH09DRAFT_1379107 [Mycena vulgaris]